MAGPRVRPWGETPGAEDVEIEWPAIGVGEDETLLRGGTACLPLGEHVGNVARERHESAVLWTQDAHFRGLDGVEFRAKE